MLYPQRNAFRQIMPLPDIWELRFDPLNEGKRTGWPDGFIGGRPAAICASWNEQFEEGRDYLGLTWYQTAFDLPWGWESGNHVVRLYFESVNYLAEVWLNGIPLGVHEGGHLPFEFDVTPHMRRERNRLVVCVDGELARVRVPPGNPVSAPEDASGLTGFPPTFYDFFPFCGIHRPVLLYAAPRGGLADITVVTEITDRDGRVLVRLSRDDNDTVSARMMLHGTDSATEAILTVPNTELWSPTSPHLYDLVVQLIRNGDVFDEYTLPVGIRTIRVDGDHLLLNGEPIYLRGFGRHEDFPVVGRGVVPAVAIKDYALMQWVGANSFRTTHYPYSELMMRMADRLGFLVIDETPAVGLFFEEDGLARRLSLCQQYVRELIDRDKNHPSVILWSLANEPNSHHSSAKPFFKDLYDLAKSLDSTRPITVVSHIGVHEEAFEFVDLMCLNRYYGWYTQPGQLDAGLSLFSDELDALYEKFRKPLIVSEFGADAVAGIHAQPPEMFSEEYQAEMLIRYIELLKTKPYVVGEHVWNLCDFKTGQSVRRVGGLNLKGVFTRDRRPKLAAHRLREQWSSE